VESVLLVQRRILEYSGAAFKSSTFPNGDRTLVWKHEATLLWVPVIKDGKAWFSR